MYTRLKYIFKVWFPTHGDAFVMLLAPIGDDITPKDFVAFYFDGSCGLQVKPGITLTLLCFKIHSAD